QTGAVADRLTVRDGPLQGFGIGLVRRPQGAFLQPRLVGLLALELVELIQALAGGLHQQSGTGVEVAVLDRQVVESQPGLAGAPALQATEYAGNQLAESAVVQLVRAGTHQQYPLGTEAR